MTDKIADAVLALSTDIAHQRDDRVRLLLHAGISKDRLSYVTLAHCPVCGGSGMVHGSRTEGKKFVATLSECPECPGLCVDGQSLIRRRNEATR